MQHLKNRKTSKGRRHRLRNSVVLTGVGATAAYFLDPENGRRRRDAAMRRTSTSAQVVGDQLDKVAHVAHQAAESTAPPPMDDSSMGSSHMDHSMGADMP